MNHSFDAGCVTEPYRTLAETYPGPDVYPADEFRVEWGPIFHRGRLDGSAKVLVVGQDPAQHETIVRRILVGEAGRRLQGFLGKLGITTSYVLINTFLYSVYGSVKAAIRRNEALVAYRNRWIDAIFAGNHIEAVVTLGTLADEAWQLWTQSASGQGNSTTRAAITHPTQPESSSKGDPAKLRAATAALLANWNAGLQLLAPAIQHPDVFVPLQLYGDTWAEGDRPGVPERDFPAGLPTWMHEQDGWASRVGSDDASKRRNITLTVPKGVIP